MFGWIYFFEGLLVLSTSDDANVFETAMGVPGRRLAYSQQERGPA